MFGPRYTSHGDAIAEFYPEETPPRIVVSRQVQLRGETGHRVNEGFELVSYHPCGLCFRDIRIVALDRNPTPFRQWMLKDGLESLGVGHVVRASMVGGIHVVTAVSNNHLQDWCHQLIAPLYPQGAYAGLWAMLSSVVFKRTDRSRNQITLKRLKTVNKEVLTQTFLEHTPAPLRLVHDTVPSKADRRLVLFDVGALDGYSHSISLDMARMVEECQRKSLTR
jgi:hypothetical protein